jgi:DNA-directed RNA polymerase specialized sigma24 family protein
LVRRRANNVVDAEDIFQDALLALATAYGLSAPIDH